MDIKLKQQFEDWESCEKNHFDFCRKTFSPILSKYEHATTVQSHNKTASSRAKGSFTQLSEKLKYAKVKIVCVHYGQYLSKAQGQRKSSTFRNSCPAHITYSANAKFQFLYVSSIDLNHNHEIGPELYEKYPANRALRQANLEDKEKVRDFVKVRGDNKLILEELRHRTGRYEIPKSLQNFKAKQLMKADIGADSAQKLINELQKDQKDDPEMIVVASVEPSTNRLEFVFWQTSRMRQIFEKYPEHFLCDATFCLNRCGMPLYIIMAVDGNLQSEIVALCLTKNGKKEFVQKLFEEFQNHNPNWNSTRSIMVDKDLAEISVLRELFPKAHVEICLFHVLKAIKSKITSLRMTKAASMAAKAHAQKLAYSYKEEDFKTNVEALLGDEVLESFPEFAKYMQENWVSIKEMWVQAYRRQHFNFGEATNNRLESYNQKIKGICRRNAALDDFYRDIKVLCTYVENINDHEKFQAKTKKEFHRYTFENSNFQDAAREIFDKVVPVYSGKVVENLMKAGSSKSTCTSVDNSDSIVIKIDNLTQVISIGITCTCSTFLTQEIPCFHIFIARIQLGKAIFSEEILSNRISKTRWVEGLKFTSVAQKRSIFKCQYPSKPNKSKTSQEKYSEAMPILQTLGNILSSCGQETFQRRMRIITKMTETWSERKDFKLFIDHKEYDPDEVIEDVGEDKGDDDSDKGDDDSDKGDDDCDKGDDDCDKGDDDCDKGDDDCDKGGDDCDKGGDDSDKGYDDSDKGDDDSDKGDDDNDKGNDDSDKRDDDSDKRDDDSDKEGLINESDNGEDAKDEKKNREKGKESLKKYRNKLKRKNKTQEQNSEMRRNLKDDFDETEPMEKSIKMAKLSSLPEIREPLKLSVVGRPKGIFQTVIGLRRKRLPKKPNLCGTESSPIRARSNRHSLTPVKVGDEVYPESTERIEETEIWLTKPRVLTKEHELSVITRAYIFCEVIDAAQLILKTQFKNITAGLNSLFRISTGIGKQDIPFIQNNVENEGFFVQIYNIRSHLFCAAGFYGEEEANISIYDSLTYQSLAHRIQRLPQLVSLLSGQFKNTNVEKLNLKYVKVTEQVEVECGTHAIANALNACLNIEPGTVEYHKADDAMRKHLHSCMEKNHLTPFSVRVHDPTSSNVLYESSHKLVYCVCRKEYTGARMIQCDKCSEWFHETCVKTSKRRPKKECKWFCEFRCEPDTIDI